MPDVKTHSACRRRPHLLQRARLAIRRRRFSYRTEMAYLHWIRRFILFHRRRHPREPGAKEITAFLAHLAVDRTLPRSSVDQAQEAVRFLYDHVVGP